MGTRLIYRNGTRLDSGIRVDDQGYEIFPISTYFDRDEENLIAFQKIAKGPWKGEQETPGGVNAPLRFLIIKDALPGRLFVLAAPAYYEARTQDYRTVARGKCSPKDARTWVTQNHMRLISSAKEWSRADLGCAEIEPAFFAQRPKVDQDVLTKTEKSIDDQIEALLKAKARALKAKGK